MKKQLVYSVFFSLLVALLEGCTSVEIGDITDVKCSSFDTKSYSNLVFHKETGLLLEPMVGGCEDDCLDSDDERATHIAVKFYPKNTEEQFFINQLEGVNVSYIPFGYKPISTRIQQDFKGSFFPTFTEINNHKLSFSEKYEEGNQWVNRELSLPVMYAICPKGMQFPQGIDYDVCYGLTLSKRARPEHLIVLPLEIKTHDNLLGEDVPLEKVKVRAEYGNLKSDRYLDSLGHTFINPYFYGLTNTQIGDITISLILESPKWIINRDSTSTTPLHIVLGSVSELWPFYETTTFTYCDTIASLYNELECHRAVSHYHYSNHPLRDSTNALESNVIIHSTSNYIYNYAVSYSSQRNIIVYNAGQSQNYTIGTVCHELGHLRHYFKINDYYFYYYGGITKLIKESYASYVGWMVGEDYYLSKGFVKPYDGYLINRQGRQFWYSNSSNYSPLFVDLIDSYNQGYYDSIYPFDQLSSVPPLIVDTMVKQDNTVEDVFDHLDDYIGVYYTSSELLTYKNAFL